MTSLRAQTVAKNEIKTAPAQRRNASREALLSAASNLMRERDTLDVSLSEIAARAGVNAALISYYFGSKRQLMLALIESASQHSFEQFQHLLDAPFSPSQKLRFHLAGIVNFYEKFPYLSRLIGVVVRDSSPAEAATISEKFIRPLIDAYARLIKEGVDKGEFKPIEPMNLYFMCIGMCGEIFASRPILRGCFGLEALSDAHKRSYITSITNIVVAGIRNGS